MERREVLERFRQAKTILAPVVDQYRKNGLDGELNKLLNHLTKLEADLIEYKDMNPRVNWLWYRDEIHNPR